MKKNTKIIIGIVIIGVILLALAGVFSEGKNINISEGNNVSVNKNYKIGAVLSLTGSAQFDGNSIKNGIELARKDLLKKGINVEVIYEDDKTDPKSTVSGIQRLPKDIHTIIGPTWSFLGDAASTTLEQKNMISLQPANTSEFVDARDSKTFFGSVKNLKKEVALSKFMQENDYKNIAYISEIGAWGFSHDGALERAAASVGGKVVLTERANFEVSSSEMSVLLLKIKKSGADMIYWTGYESGSLNLLKNYMTLNLNIPIVGDSLLDIDKSHDIAKSITSGVYITETFENSDFADRYMNEYGEQESIYSDSAYDMLMLWVEAMENTNGSVDVVDEYLTNTTHYEGYAKTYDFDDNGDIIDGEWILKKVI